MSHQTRIVTKAKSTVTIVPLAPDEIGRDTWVLCFVTVTMGSNCKQRCAILLHENLLGRTSLLPIVTSSVYQGIYSEVHYGDGT